MRARWLVTRWFVGLLFLLLAGASVLMPGTVVRAATINVPADQPTIQAAINAAAPNDTIVIAAGTYTGAGNIGVTVNKAVTIQGAGAGQTIIDGQHSSQVFNVTATGVAFSDLTIQNGINVPLPIGGGIAITSVGTVTVTNSAFSGNGAQSGGGIASNGTLIVTDSTFSGNGAPDGTGGGIFSTGTLTVTNSTFSANTGAEGGAIFNSGGTLTVMNSTFSGNSIPSTGSSTGGGGIANTGTMFVTNSTFSGNFDTVGGGGGGLYNEGSGRYS